MTDFFKQFLPVEEEPEMQDSFRLMKEVFAEGLAKKTFVRFPHSEYMRMRRHAKVGHYFFATWNYQLGKYRVGAQGGYGYEQQTIDFVERDLRKLIQSIVDTYNKATTSSMTWDVIDPMPEMIKFEAVSTTKAWPARDSLGMRVIGVVVSDMGYEMLIIESKEEVVSSSSGDPDDWYR